MKLRNIIFGSLIAAVAFVLTGCEEPVAPKDEIVNFTVRFSEVAYDYAIINVKHDGPEEITWYGFLTEDVTTQEFTLINKEWMNLLTSGKAIDVRRETERNILLEGLKEDSSYKYIVFGLTGTGYFDLVAYQKYNDGVMDDYIPTDDDIAASLAQCPKIG